MITAQESPVPRAPLSNKQKREALGPSHTFNSAQEFSVIIGGKTEQLADLTWFAARVGPFAEFKVADELMELGLDAYAPWETVWCVNPRRTWLRKVKKFPMIPRYVFVKLDRQRPRTDLVEGVAGVQMLRTSGGAPCPVENDALDRIRWHQIRGLYDCTTENNATAKRKAKKALQAAVREAQVGKTNPRGAAAAARIEQTTGKIHPFGPTYRVVSR